MPHSGPHFLRCWCDLVPKSSILGAPWRPVGPKMAPKIAQVAQKRAPKVKISHILAFLETTCFKDCFRNAPGHHFLGFLMDFFDPLFKDFSDF